MDVSSLFVSAPSKSINTLGMGMFDGIHRGHQHVLSNCDTLLTFYPHPREFLSHLDQFFYLTPLNEKIKLFNHVVVLKFAKYLSQLSPVEFLNLVRSLLSPRKIVVGYDFKFGKDRLGSVDDLVSWGQLNKIEIEIKEPYLESGKPIKSSMVRHYVQLGDIKSANHLLGRSYGVLGTVVQGDQRGRRLGFPTANLMISPYKLLPRQGVYFGLTTVAGRVYRSALSIGMQSTFDVQKMVVEVHLIGFDGDLYGEEILVEVHQFIREQSKFESANSLKDQIRSDIQLINSL